jgi:hyaluronan synthase
MLPWMLGHAPVLSIFFLADIILPFLLVGTIAGWIYRSATGTGVNLYEAMLETYGAQAGWFWVIALMVVSSVLSMAIRQIRHLQEVPSDFFRLPIFIIVSTFFLMPVRLLGFLRMAHASGWGTRAGAYAGGDPGSAEETPRDSSLEAELGLMSGTAPVDVVDRPAGGFPTQKDHATDPGTPVHAHVSPAALAAGDAPESTPTAAAVLAAPDLAAPDRQAALATLPESSRRQARTAAPAPTRKRLNPLAAIPYGIAVILFALEALLYV